jgi:DNA-binding transcriptional ArsR family regulator
VKPEERVLRDIHCFHNCPRLSVAYEGRPVKKQLLFGMTDDKPLETVLTIVHLLSNPLRLRILLLLDKAPPEGLSVTAIQEITACRQAIISRYLLKMKQAGLLISRRQGQNVFYSLTETSYLTPLTLFIKTRKIYRRSAGWEGSKGISVLLTHPLKKPSSNGNRRDQDT